MPFLSGLAVIINLKIKQMFRNIQSVTTVNWHEEQAYFKILFFCRPP